MSNRLSGVLPTPTGSEVNRLSAKDNNEINNGNMAELLSQRGIEYIKQVIRANIENGASIGVTSTFRVTPFRPAETGDWSSKSNLVLPEQYAEWNRALIQLAKEGYDGKPILGNIAPITNTSPSLDDKRFAEVGSSARDRIEFAKRHHDPQIRLLAEEGIDSVLVEACRHPDDALGIVSSAKEHGIDNVVVSFEAEEDGLPDPIYKRKNYRFSNLKEQLSEEAGNEVLIGVNCINASLLAALVDRGEKLDIAYPNQADTSRCPPSLIKRLWTLVNEEGDATLRAGLRKELHEASETPLPEFRALIEKCLTHNVHIVGNCCGGRPEHVKEASEAYENHSSASQTQVKELELSKR